ncbi:30S ribosomal protein S2 [Candidatus Saccharibacteria bacterium]|nr:30S ribosomal protein S2 [Candidatus Saccharibacteria bacterium]MCB9821324.1 30S ribosomal protein S2 [Candidatus Nomurabacteria bacterium]
MSSKVDVDIKALLEAGSHFGHKTSRWHPKMAQYIHSKRGGSHIIDLAKTVDSLEEALGAISKATSHGKKVLFVGTKRQAKEILRKAAESVDMPYVVERWMGGMLTNQKTIGAQIKKLKDHEAKMASGEYVNRYNKLEVQRIQEDIDRGNMYYGGIKDMVTLPGIVFVSDMITDITAIREANKLGIPVVAIADTNTDPTTVKYPIPANDDAIKSIELITGYIVKAIELGKASSKAAPSATKETEAKEGDN